MDDQSLIEIGIDSRGFMFVRLGTIAVHIVIIAAVQMPLDLSYVTTVECNPVPEIRLS